MEKKRLWGSLVTVTAASLYFLLPIPLSVTALRTLFLFVIGAIFWAFEIIPLFATAISLVVFLSILTPVDGQNVFLSQFANPIIFLFFGGLVLAKALQKHRVDQYIANAFFNWIGTKPFSILCGYLFFTAFLSMWISNTAAAAIVLSLIAPILLHLPEKDPLKKGLPLAVAFGASIGGIATPIGTPPNALAIGILVKQNIYVSFLSWMGMALPLTLLILTLSTLVLWLLFPSKAVLSKEVHQEVPLTKKAKGVIFGASAMVILWLTAPFHKMSEALVALIGVSYFASFAYINLDDLKRIEWDVLLLMWGGLALGEAMSASGMIPALFGTGTVLDPGIWLFAGFCLLALILSSFMSNTATANLLLPITASFSPNNKILLAITIALSCSLALTFPISTPPNALAYSLRSFETKDMFKAGFIISILSIIMILLGFHFVIPFFFKA